MSGSSFHTLGTTVINHQLGHLTSVVYQPGCRGEDSVAVNWHGYGEHGEPAHLDLGIPAAMDLYAHLRAALVTRHKSRAGVSRVVGAAAKPPDGGGAGQLQPK